MEVVLTFVKNYFVLMLIFLSVVISDTKGSLSEIFSFFCQRARDHRAGTAAFGLCGRNEKRRGKAAAA